MSGHLLLHEGREKRLKNRGLTAHLICNALSSGWAAMLGDIEGHPYYPPDFGDLARYLEKD
jgi:hypothetical protein